MKAELERMHFRTKFGFVIVVLSEKTFQNHLQQTRFIQNKSDKAST